MTDGCHLVGAGLSDVVEHSVSTVFQIFEHHGRFLPCTIFFQFYYFHEKIQRRGGGLPRSAGHFEDVTAGGSKLTLVIGRFDGERPSGTDLAVVSMRMSIYNASIYTKSFLL